MFVLLIRNVVFGCTITEARDHMLSINRYGCLYDWEKAMEICPEGRHLPSDEEWIELERFIGITEDILRENIPRGDYVDAPGKLGVGSSLWNSHYADYTNETGFSAVPGGMRMSGSNGDETMFWTSSHGKNDIWKIFRIIVPQGIGRYHFYDEQGLSVRCIKD